MENKVMGWCALALAMMGFATSAVASSNDISCGQALTYLLPCQTFLVGAGPPSPSVGCCLGVQRVWKEASTTQIRRNLCLCFKQAAKSLGVQKSRSESIPQFCNVNLPVPLDPSIDCNTVPV